MTVRQSRQRALSVVHLIDALVNQQHGLVVRPEQAGGERPLAKHDGAALDRETGVDSCFDLGGRDGRAVGEEMRGDFARGA